MREGESKRSREGLEERDRDGERGEGGDPAALQRRLFHTHFRRRSESAGRVHSVPGAGSQPLGHPVSFSHVGIPDGHYVFCYGIGWSSSLLSKRTFE